MCSVFEILCCVGLLVVVCLHCGAVSSATLEVQWGEPWWRLCSNFVFTPDQFRVSVKVFRYAQLAYNVDMCFSGFNISQRRRRKSIIGFQHRITKEESIKWFQSKVTDADCITGTEAYTPLTHCPFSVHLKKINLVSKFWVMLGGGGGGRSLVIQIPESLASR